MTSMIEEENGLRVLVCGGRNFENRKLIGRTLRDLGDAEGIACIIEGGARGADHIAKLWGEAQGLPVIEVRANWLRYGKRAGPVRNQWMLDHGKPDVVVAFPGGTGTADMVMRAERGGFRVIRAMPSAGSPKGGDANAAPSRSDDIASAEGGGPNNPMITTALKEDGE